MYLAIVDPLKCKLQCDQLSIIPDQINFLLLKSLKMGPIINGGVTTLNLLPNNAYQLHETFSFMTSLPAMSVEA